MYGMYGKLIAQAGKRNELAEVLTRAAALVTTMTGCRLYIVNMEADDDTTVSVFEVWDDKAAHDASLTDDRVRSLIAEAMPLLDGPPKGSELKVIGGHGLPA